MLPWLKRLLNRRPNSPLPTVEADVNGFSLTVKHRTRSVAWEVVRKISAYKMELQAHDQVVLLIEVTGLRHSFISIPDACPGFATLFGPMEQALGINPLPYLESMSSTVQPTPTVIYLRLGEDSDTAFSRK